MYLVYKASESGQNVLVVFPKKNPTFNWDWKNWLKFWLFVSLLKIWFLSIEKEKKSVGQEDSLGSFPDFIINHHFLAAIYLSQVSTL